jgi:hypothetical protein
MEMWQWLMLFSAVSLNTVVNCIRLFLEFKNSEEVPKYLGGKI